MEEGEANRYLNLHEQGYLLAESQADLVPFQRMVLNIGMEKKQEKIEEQQQQAGGGGGGHATNPLAEPGGGQTMKGETVEYHNTHGGEKDVDI